VTPFLTRSLTWLEVANGTSIMFDLRITAVARESEAETHGRFVAEAIRIVGAFLLEQGAGQAMRRPCETRSREQKLSSVNARGFFICKIGYVIAPPLSPPSPGVSSLTWTAGESRAVLFSK
jgi:hypothetical protein